MENSQPNTGQQEIGLDRDRIECPTCRAEQVLSAECRRCRCDLGLLQDLWRQVAQTRRHCMATLERREYVEAVQVARVAYQAIPDDHNRELLATCLLLAGEYLEARSLLR